MGDPAPTAMPWENFEALLKRCSPRTEKDIITVCEHIETHLPAFTPDQQLEALRLLIGVMKYRTPRGTLLQGLNTAAHEALRKLPPLIKRGHRLRAFNIVREQAFNVFRLPSAFLRTLAPHQQMQPFIALFAIDFRCDQSRTSPVVLSLKALLETLAPQNHRHVLRHFLGKMHDNALRYSEGVNAICKALVALLPHLHSSNDDLLFEILRGIAAHTDRWLQETFASALSNLIPVLAASGHRQAHTLAILDSLLGYQNTRIADRVCCCLPALAEVVIPSFADRVFALLKTLTSDFQHDDYSAAQTMIALLPKLQAQANRDTAMMLLEQMAENNDTVIASLTTAFLAKLAILKAVIAIASDEPARPNNDAKLLSAYGMLQQNQYAVTSTHQPAVLAYFEAQFTRQQDDNQARCEVLLLLAVCFDDTHRFAAFTQLLLTIKEERHEHTLSKLQCQLAQSLSPEHHTPAMTLLLDTLFNNNVEPATHALAQTVLEVFFPTCRETCGERFVTYLAEKARDANANTRLLACTVLAAYALNLDPAQQPAVCRCLCRLAKDGEQDIRKQACKGFRPLAPVVAFPQWQQMLQRLFAVVNNQQEAQGTLSAVRETLPAFAQTRFLSGMPKMVAAFCRLARHAAEDIRWSAVVALSHFAEATLIAGQKQQMTDCLCTLTNDERYSVWHAALQALKIVAPQFSLPQQQQVADRLIHIIQTNNARFSCKQDETQETLKMLMRQFAPEQRQAVIARLQELANNQAPQQQQASEAAQKTLRKLDLPARAA